MDVAEDARGQIRPRRHVGGVEPTWEADLNRGAVVGELVPQRDGLRRQHGDGFLAEGGDPRPRACADEVGMRGGRRCDDDAVDSRREQVGGLRGDADVQLLADPLRKVGDRVSDDELVDRREIRERLRVEGTDAPHADESDPHDVSSPEVVATTRGRPG